MAFRKIYKDLLEKKILTTVFRPGVRDCKKYRGYCQGEIIKAKIIDKQGLDRVKVGPLFLKDLVKNIQIENIEVMPLGSLTRKDFIGSSPDVQDKKSLIYHLGLIYNLDISELSNDSLVTKIKFSYKD